MVKENEELGNRKV